ncbi:MAG TPA: ATP-binding cassette domain-containing protein [Xanthobacteraceae bacterium]|nr:ATP-binding cassette domain-containing protein [Xanthobacteraceae bacterium]
MLELAGLSKRFGGLKAVDDVTLTVPQGRITAIIGPNGAGKTTLFGLISGFLTPDSGAVRFEGADIAAMPPHLIAARGLVRTFQIVQPFAGLTVRENIAVGCQLHAPSRRAALADADEVARMVGIADLLDRPAHALTIAGRKRIELARALATRPKLLLLDEVMAGLNPVEIGEMLAIVRAIRDRGITLLLTEHVMAAVMSLAEHVHVLNDGRLIAEGAPAQVADNPAVIEAYLGHGAAREGGIPAPPAGEGQGGGLLRADAAKGFPPPDALRASTPDQVRGRLSPPSGGGTEPILTVENLHAGYGPMPVLRGIDLAVGANEIVAVLGSNGAGKTTLNRALSGLLAPARGSIRFDGAEIASRDPAAIVAAGLVQVPEGRRVFPNLSVRENLELGSYRRGRPTRERNIDEVAALFPRLGGRLNQLAGTLSGGEQQMLAIARGLMAEPRLLILDEPSLGLSPRLVEDMFALIGRLRAEGRAILLVEQNVMQSLAIADRAYVLEHGVFALAGPAAELIATPRLQQTYLGL